MQPTGISEPVFLPFPKFLDEIQKFFIKSTFNEIWMFYSISWQKNYIEGVSTLRSWNPLQKKGKFTFSAITQPILKLQKLQTPFGILGTSATWLNEVKIKIGAPKYIFY